MLLHAHAALSGECSYYVHATRYHHARIMWDFTPLVNDTFNGTLIFSPSVRSSIVHTCNSYSVYRQLCPEIISHKVSWNFNFVQYEPVFEQNKKCHGIISIFSQYTDLHYICIKPASGSKQNMFRDISHKKRSAVPPVDARVNIASY